jgi:flagellar hook-basal body complex protein FliE
MTAPIGGIGAMSGVGGPRRIGLDIAGEGGAARFQMPEGGTSFGDTLKKVIGDVSTQQDTAQDYINRFVRGEPVELHQVMAASEEAQLSLEMLVELRNKLMDAYKSVVNMG